MSWIPLELFFTHTWPLIPVISNCISLPLVYQCPVDYCYNVRWFVWVPVLCVLGFVPLWIAQMISSCVLIIVRLCYLFEALLALLFGFLTCVLYSVCLVFVPLPLHSTLYFGYNKNPYYAFLHLSPDPIQVELFWVPCRTQKGSMWNQRVLLWGQLDKPSRF